MHSRVHGIMVGVVTHRDSWLSCVVHAGLMMSHGMGPPQHMAMSPPMQGMGVQGMREGMGDALGGSPEHQHQQQQQMPPRRGNHGGNSHHSPSKP